MGYYHQDNNHRSNDQEQTTRTVKKKKAMEGSEAYIHSEHFLHLHTYSVIMMLGFDFSSYILAFRSYIYISSTAFAFDIKGWVNRNYLSKIHGLGLEID